MDRADHRNVEAIARLAAAAVGPEGKVVIPKDIRDVVPWLTATPPIRCVSYVAADGGLGIELARPAAPSEARFHRALTERERLSELGPAGIKLARLMAASWPMTIHQNYQFTIPKGILRLGLLPDVGRPVAFLGGKEVLELWDIPDLRARLQLDESMRDRLLEAFMDSIGD